MNRHLPSAWRQHCASPLMRLVAWLLCCAATPAFASPALAGRNGYLGCHAAASKLVGPAHHYIAAR